MYEKKSREEVMTLPRRNRVIIAGGYLNPINEKKMQVLSFLSGGCFLVLGLYILNVRPMFNMDNFTNVCTFISFLMFGVLHFQSKRRTAKHKRRIELINEQIKLEELQEMKLRNELLRESRSGGEEKVLGV